MVKIHPNVIAYLDKFAGEPLVDKLEAAIVNFVDSKRYLPEEGEIQNRALRRYWWSIDNHSLLLYITPPDAYILGVIDGEVRGREGVKYYLEKLMSDL